MKPTGEQQAWSAVGMLNRSAWSAIRLVSMRPPEDSMSGWMMSTARVSMASRKPSQAYQSSPAATGVRSASATFLWPGMSVQGNGSSIHARLNGSSARPILIASSAVQNPSPK
jgi:hypothetical protein